MARIRRRSSVPMGMGVTSKRRRDSSTPPLKARITRNGAGLSPRKQPREVSTLREATAVASSRARRTPRAGAAPQAFSASRFTCADTCSPCKARSSRRSSFSAQLGDAGLAVANFVGRGRIAEPGRERFLSQRGSGQMQSLEQAASAEKVKVPRIRMGVVDKTISWLTHPRPEVFQVGNAPLIEANDTVRSPPRARRGSSPEPRRRTQRPGGSGAGVAAVLSRRATPT